MKNLLKALNAAAVLLAVVMFYSCEKSPEQNPGTTEFAIAMPGDQLKSGSTSDSVTVAYHLMVSIEDMQGNLVFGDSLIPLYSFGTGYVSEKIKLNAGEFRLTKFMVINASGTVVYASPLAGSPLAYLIKRPLPMGFNVYPGRVTQVTPEVLAVGDNTPDKFGYAAFGISVVKPLTFWTAAVIDNPMIMAPYPLYTEARLTVIAKDGWRFSFKLIAGINKLIIRGGSDVYVLVLEKEGYAAQKFEVPAEKLRATTPENPLILKIPHDSTVIRTFVLQPGPEDGKDAMISQLEPDKNFGAHKYFEATFLSEPVLTVMRLNRSLIHFRMPQTFAPVKIVKVVLRLSYEVPVAWDSAHIAPNTTAGTFIGGALQQVTEPWEENAVTWNKQPASTELNQVLIPPFIRNVNFIDVDVTKLFMQISTVNMPNYGMKFKLIPEDKWPGFRFASSDHPNIVLRPKLTIYYTN